MFKKVDPATENNDSQELRPCVERILKAAVQVFAEHGVKGATTKEIARVAGVNETTLFRNFKTKELLLSAVVEASSRQIRDSLSGEGMSHQDLRKDLAHYMTVYNRVLEEHEAIVRMFIGETPRQKEGACSIVIQAWQPVREQLVQYLEAAKQRGQVRPEIDSLQAVEILKGMILANLLRRGAYSVSYSTEHYLETALDIFVRGIIT